MVRAPRRIRCVVRESWEWGAYCAFLAASLAFVSDEFPRKGGGSMIDSMVDGGKRE